MDKKYVIMEVPEPLKYRANHVSLHQFPDDVFYTTDEAELKRRVKDILYLCQVTPEAIDKAISILLGEGE
jgi:hypothetical protein